RPTSRCQWGITKADEKILRSGRISANRNLPSQQGIHSLSNQLTFVFAIMWMEDPFWRLRRVGWETKQQVCRMPGEGISVQGPINRLLPGYKAKEEPIGFPLILSQVLNTSSKIYENVHSNFCCDHCSNFALAGPGGLLARRRADTPDIDYLCQYQQQQQPARDG